jgi:hypothetical protein
MIKHVTGPQAKEISLQEKDAICGPCTKKEEKLLSTVERLKKTWDHRIEKMVAEAKDEIVGAIKKGK